eukprot:COSAG03_NODE_8217_length_825_cov_1.201102_2_plen_76_part_01
MRHVANAGVPAVALMVMAASKQYITLLYDSKATVSLSLQYPYRLSVSQCAYTRIVLVVTAGLMPGVTVQTVDLSYS